MANSKITSEIGVTAKVDKASLSAAESEVKSFADKVGESATKAQEPLTKLGETTTKTSEKVDRATKSMIAAIQRSQAEITSVGRGTSDYFEKIAQIKGIDAGVLTPYINQLKAAEAAQAAARGSLDGMGMSAKATSAALRQLPAQFTDIVVSLQGGQAPLTVLLQQGGQLKDVFGGVGVAARAMGNYILGLVNPFTVAAAAIGTVGYAAYSGAEEMHGFNTALTTTGNRMGATAGQLQGLAASMSTFGITQGRASEALVAFANAGVQGSQALREATEAAIAWERATGTAVEKTAEKFGDLRRAPLETTMKLNEGLGFVTESLYKQIKALEDNGKATQAADLAQKAFADTLKSRSDEVLQNLGLIERGWNGIKDAAKAAWDAAKGIGRETTLDTQIAELTKKRDQYKANGYNTDKEDAELAAMTKRLMLQRDSAQVQAQAVAQAEALSKWDKAGLEYLDRKAKMEREIAKARGEGAEAGRSQAEIEQRIADIREKYRDKSEKKKDEFGLNRDQAAAYAKFLADFQRDAEKADKELFKLTDGQSKLMAMLQDPLFQQMPETWRQTALQAAYATIAIEQSADANKVAEKALKEVTAAREADLRKLRESADSATKKAQQIEDEVALYGMSEEAITNLTIARLRDEQAKQMSYGDEAAVQAIEDEINALKRLAKAKDALRLKDDESKAAKKAEEAWARAAEKIESSLTDALMRGFEAGKGFAENLRDAVVNMFKTMVLRPIVELGVRGGLSIAGLGGVSGAASAAEVLGNVGNAGSALNGLSQLKGLTSWLTDFGGSAANSIVKAGELAYQAGFEKIGSSMMSLSEAGSFSKVADGLNMVGDGLGYLNAAMAASEGKWGAAAGSAIGTYFGGPIGAFIGNAVGGWIDSAFGGGREYTTGTGISGKFSKQGFAGSNYQDWRNDGSSGLFGIGASGSSSGTNYSAMDASLQKSLGSAYGTIITQTAGFAAALGANANTIVGFQKDIKLALGSDAEANKKAIADMFKGLANEVAGTVLDAQYIREGEGAADTLARLATNLTVVNGALDTLSDNLLTVGQASGDAASSLVDSFGGLTKYQDAIATYYQRFYSQEERMAKTREQVTKQLASLGFAVPDTMAAFRELVNAQDLTTESGRKAYAALIGMSGAFADITEAAQTAQTKLLDIAKSLNTLLKDIASARSDVAAAREKVSPSPVMTAEAIRAAVVAATISASQAGITAAAQNLGAKNVAAAQADIAQKNAQTNATAAGQGYTSLVDSNAAYVNSIKAAAAEIHNLANAYGTHGQGIMLSSVWAPTTDGLNNSAYNYNAATNRVNPYAALGGRSWTDSQSWLQGGKSTTYYADINGLMSNPRYQALNAMLGGANYNLAQYEQLIARAATSLATAQSALTTATSNKAAADAAAKKAAEDYAKAVDAWVVEASKSVPQLNKLREETLRYYEAQKALAEGMAASAQGLRDAIAAARESQLDSQQLTKKRLADYGQAYSMALSTTGYTQIGYADKMAALLPELTTSLQDQASTSAQWAAATGVLFAQAEKIASTLDQTAPVNYQADSLALLDTIDASLAVLDDSTRAITRAIDASGGTTAAGLREVVRALGGTPAFASGGFHSGGLRLVGENGPELEVTGPSRIFNAAQTADILRGGNNSQGLTTAELAAMRILLRDLRDGQLQTATMMQRMVKINEKWDGDGLPSTRVETA